MPYLPLPNFDHDSGPRRIQSGPDHEGYIVLYSGVQSTGPDDGLIVAGSPLSGTVESGVWGYDANWRYVPTVTVTQEEVKDSTAYNVSGALDTYDGTRIYTRDNVGGAQAASAIGPETGKINPRGGALQPRANVTRPETYMYYGGAAPDNQDYSPYNTPDANSAAEGKTGGGVTHRSYESTLLTNVLGSQGTSDRSQWRYHQPVYCKTYTETRRSGTPGLMSTPLRFVYRGSATSYVGNFGYQLLAGPGFEPLEYDEYIPEETPEEPIIIESAPFLWLSYTLGGSSISFNFDESAIVLDRFCNSYQVFLWDTGSGLLYPHVVKRDVNGEIIWQKKYGEGVLQQPTDDPFTVFDRENEIIYVCVPTDFFHCLLSLDLDGNVLFSKIISKPSPSLYSRFAFYSLNINPITSDITLAGSAVLGPYNTAGVVVTFNKNGVLLDDFTKMSDAINAFSPTDCYNEVRSVTYDSSGNIFLTLNYTTQDDFFGIFTARRAFFVAKIDTNGNSSNLRLIGEYKRLDEPGYAATDSLFFKSSLITEDNKFLVFGNTYGSFLLDTTNLNVETVYTNRFLLSMQLKLKKDGEYFLFPRRQLVASFPGQQWYQSEADGSVESFKDYEFTSIKYLDLLALNTGARMFDGDISPEFDYGVASFGQQTSSPAKFYCAGFKPEAPYATLSSGASIFFQAESEPSSLFPKTLQVNPSGVATSGTRFSMYPQGAVTVGDFLFTVNESSFTCPKVDTESPVWVRLATSGTYNPSL